MKSLEKYQPSVEEIKTAEDMMTRDQKEMSKLREKKLLRQETEEKLSNLPPLYNENEEEYKKNDPKGLLKKYYDDFKKNVDQDGNINNSIFLNNIIKKGYGYYPYGSVTREVADQLYEIVEGAAYTSVYFENNRDLAKNALRAAFHGISGMKITGGHSMRYGGESSAMCACHLSRDLGEVANDLGFPDLADNFSKNIYCGEYGSPQRLDMSSGSGPTFTGKELSVEEIKNNVLSEIQARINKLKLTTAEDSYCPTEEEQKTESKEHIDLLVKANQIIDEARLVQPFELPQDFDRHEKEIVMGTLKKIAADLLHFDLRLWDGQSSVGSEVFIDLLKNEPLEMDSAELIEDFEKNTEESENKYITKYDRIWTLKEISYRFVENERSRAERLALIAARLYKAGEKSLSDEALELAKTVANNNARNDLYYHRWEPYLPISLAQLVRGENNEEYLNKSETGIMVGSLGSWERDGIMPGERKRGLINVAKMRYLSNLPISETLKNLRSLSSDYPELDKHIEKQIELLERINEIMKESIRINAS